ncbi:GrpB family protein [Bacillus clarus]|uniref:GrpB family protein n=1 Tax=Bacillus clarus TaxID=2338372 RepID=A0A090YKH2_9BACI|nr:GrpB family protein [Bacillus clarus]KFM98706.1 grpB family protein [Bacillus clarus]RFT64357.1 GrpB family protein [Bacillus clarus]
MDQQIIIEPYHSNWHNEFLNEKKRFMVLLNEDIAGIEHIGSTSVEGLGAKSLIDMMIGVEDLKVVDTWIEQLATIEYEYVPKETSKWRFFRKGKWRAGTHHLHIYIYNSEEWKNNLLFRDFLRSHEWACKEYQKLKEKLAVMYPHDRVAYTNAKAPFIQNTIAIARKCMHIDRI